VDSPKSGSFSTDNWEPGTYTCRVNITDEAGNDKKYTAQFTLHPLPSCGDPLPTDSSLYTIIFYPVFVPFSEENLQNIVIVMKILQ